MPGTGPPRCRMQNDGPPENDTAYLHTIHNQSHRQLIIEIRKNRKNRAIK
jgi:hypothetical protein